MSAKVHSNRFILELSGSLAGREASWLEVLVAALGLLLLTLAIFVWGLGLPIPVWPER